MGKLLDKVLIIDVESTCWNGKTPENQVSEIIEIGLAVLDIDTLEIEDNRGILVKPVQSEISEFCTELTTITPEMIENEGIDFAEACEILFKDYFSKKRTWASWGAYDWQQFQRNCQQREITYPFSTTHINAKNLFALKHRLKNELGMARALEVSKIKLEGTHHRGVDDARNIAKIFRTLI